MRWLLVIPLVLFGWLLTGLTVNSFGNIGNILLKNKAICKFLLATRKINCFFINIPSIIGSQPIWLTNGGRQ
ncbi:hypothetical protein D1859_03515 [Priestia flexa]|nr:hypothetical protein D1859_03515 [Priestia flexa]